MPKQPTPTIKPKERAYLIGTEIDSDILLLTMEDSLRELSLLADTAGLDVVGQSTQRLKKPDPKTYIGSGKVEEIKQLSSETLADVLIFDDELSPRHQRELEKIFGDDLRVIDRSALILDVFAQHAETREGALQVELAQYEYRIPRLTRAWTHLARQAGGGGGRAGARGGVGLRGPGETQLEVDRQVINRRIAQLQRELEKVRAHRSRHRSRRKESSIPIVALVGYTNAGKSTLLNRLSGAEVYVANQLFATLDPTTRRIDLSNGRVILLTDTVGFIQKLPTSLVAAFRATLEEISEADLLLHVVDISHRNALAQAESVRNTLDEIEASEVPMVTALNKIDLLKDESIPEEILDTFEDAVPISAVNGAGLDTLLTKIEREIEGSMVPMTVDIPYESGHLISLYYQHGVIDNIEHFEKYARISGHIPQTFSTAFNGLEVNVKRISDTS